MKHLIYFALLLIFGCSKPFEIVKVTDEFNPGVYSIKTSEMTIKGSDPFDMTEIYLELRYVHSEEKNLNFKMYTFRYVGKDWAFLYSARTITGNNVNKYEPLSDPKRAVGGYPGVTEILVFEFPDDDIEAAISSKVFKINLVGERRSFTIELDQGEIKNIEKWYNTVKKLDK